MNSPIPDIIRNMQDIAKRLRKLEARYFKDSPAPDPIERVALNIVVGNGLYVIPTGIWCWITISKFDLEITTWKLVANASGSVELDVWAGAWGDLPLDSGDSMCDGHYPALSTAQTAKDTDLSDWSTTDLTAEDYIYINVRSCTTIKQVTLTLLGKE